MKTKTKFKQTEIGMIPADWEVKPIKELVKVNENSINKDFKFSEIEYIDIDSVDNGIISNRQYLLLKESPSRAKRIIKDNDIIISTVRPNLKHFAFIKEAKPNTIVSTGFAVISCKKVNPKFLYYYLTTDKLTNYLTAIADSHTSTYPSFNPDIIENSLAPYPSEPEQSAIAKILSDLDSKIELNQQMNKTLEAIGMAIFKHWFIDFEFPNEEGKPYKSSGGEMVDSGLGMIPKGFMVEQLLTRASSIQYGLTRSASEESLGPQFLRITDIQGGTIDWDKVPFCKVSPSEHDRYRIHPGDILVARTGASTGENVYIIDVPDAVFASYLVRFQFSNPHEARVVASFMRTETYFDYVAGIIGGSAQPNASAQVLAGASFAFPPASIAKRFAEIVRPLDMVRAARMRESRILGAIRNVLLPKLLSGKVRIPVEVK